MKRFNLTALVIEHLFNAEKHCKFHRCGAGLVVMGVGCGFAYIFASIGMEFLGTMGCSVFHAVGASPLVENFFKQKG